MRQGGLRLPLRESPSAGRPRPAMLAGRFAHGSASVAECNIAPFRLDVPFENGCRVRQDLSIALLQLRRLQYSEPGQSRFERKFFRRREPNMWQVRSRKHRNGVGVDVNHGGSRLDPIGFHTLRLTDGGYRDIRPGHDLPSSEAQSRAHSSGNVFKQFGVGIS